MGLSSCNIIIKDEVNVKIEGLDLDTRKRLHKMFKYELPYARHLPAVKLGRWDGTKAFFGLGGTTYLSFMERVIPEIVRDGYEVNLVDNRNQTPLEFTKVVDTHWADQGITWPEGHPEAGKPLMLRDYQPELINTFFENPQSIQEIATGAGKTILTATLCQAVEKYGRSIVIVPNKGLVEQTEEDFVNCGLDVGVYYGDRKDLNATHTICTWQSLNILEKTGKADGEALSLLDLIEGVYTVIVDEVHQAKADVLTNLLTGALAHCPIRWGLTGTVPKQPFEYEGIFASIGPVVGHLAAHELQEQGYLSNCHITVIQTNEWKEFKSYPEELKYLVTDPDRLKALSNLIKDISQTGNTLILVDRIETGNQLEELIPDSVFISGEIKSKKRKEHYKEVAVVDDKVIIATYGVAAVGINIPRIFNLVMIEAGKSFTRVIQSIGRGIRVAEDKDYVDVWDLTATTKYAKRHLTERKKYYKDAKYPFTIKKVDYANLNVEG
jgi:superfamily II DNA or RNA helicase